MCKNLLLAYYKYNHYFTESMFSIEFYIVKDAWLAV